MMLYLAIYSLDGARNFHTFYASSDSDAEYRWVHIERPAGATTHYVARVIAN